MFSREELQHLKERATGPQFNLTVTDLRSLIDQAIEQQTTIDRWFGFLSLIARSGSSWSDRIKALLDEYLFGTTDTNVIEATKALLAKHKNHSVATVLEKLDKLDAPIQRSRR